MPKSIEKFKSQTKARVYRNKQRRNNYEKGRKGAIKTFSRWTPKEMEFLLNWKGTDFELHRVLKRSVQAIQGKRNRIKYGGL